MGLDDKISNAAEKLTGSAKEKAGDATGNEDLQAEGAGQESVADLKQAGEKIKDAFKS
ncbi:CsbD-like protein [Motilibacter peucedani]|uniref:CsbD-like protein n=1 Tax=Motilibacter peucedani TaxID=598650 RepID=A0A420XKN7_9ACTN|nr:CsbD family protein [Motilibacter peucedani]RKS69202.1 CsbD-like protein [Motilibacter peucedani]